MTLLFASVILALAAGAWVVYPLLFRRWGLLGDRIPGHVLDSEAKKRVALAALKDVEYDRAAGKLDDADYREIRSKLEREALEAIQAIERGAGSAVAEAHSCGFRNPPGSRFCSGCGRPLS